MIVTLLLILLVFCVSLASIIHGIGVWLTMMVVHGALVHVFGSGVVHAPMYSGIVLVLVALASGSWKGTNVNFVIIMCLLITLMALATLLGLDTENSLSALFLYAKGFILAIVIAGCLKNIRDVKVVSSYLLAGIIMGSLMTVYQDMTGQHAISNIYVQRAAGLRKDPNDTAMLLVAGLPIAFYWLSHIKTYLAKFALAGVITLILIGVVLTGSRGGFVTVCAMAGILYLRKPTVITTLLGMGVIVVGLILMPPSYKDRMITLVTGVEPHGGRSIESRSKLLATGTTIFFDNILTGVGPGNYGIAFNKAENIGPVAANHDLAISDTIHVAAHNMYMEFFVENGVFTGILFLSVFYIALSGLYRMRDDYTEGNNTYSLGFLLSLSLFGLLFSGIFLSQGKNSVLWFMVGVGFASYKFRAKRMIASGNGPD